MKDYLGITVSPKASSAAQEEGEFTEIDNYARDAENLLSALVADVSLHRVLSEREQSRVARSDRDVDERQDSVVVRQYRLPFANDAQQTGVPDCDVAFLQESILEGPSSENVASRAIAIEAERVFERHRTYISSAWSPGSARVLCAEEDQRITQHLMQKLRQESRKTGGEAFASLESIGCLLRLLTRLIPRSDSEILAAEWSGKDKDCGIVIAPDLGTVSVPINVPDRYWTIENLHSIEGAEVCAENFSPPSTRMSLPQPNEVCGFFKMLRSRRGESRFVFPNDRTFEDALTAVDEELRHVCSRYSPARYRAVLPAQMIATSSDICLAQVLSGSNLGCVATSKIEDGGR